MHIKKDDTVQVQTGDDKGKTGRVLEVLPDEGKVLVEGVNRVYKHLKPNRQNPQGGRLSKEMPVDASNVLLFCPNCRRGVRIGRRYLDDGRKERYCKRCGNGLGRLSKPRAAYARKENE
jgi:large subunit ribosomal protein L24